MRSPTELAQEIERDGLVVAAAKDDPDCALLVAALYLAEAIHERGDGYHAADVEEELRVYRRERRGR